MKVFIQAGLILATVVLAGCHSGYTDFDGTVGYTGQHEKFGSYANPSAPVNQGRYALRHGAPGDPVSAVVATGGTPQDVIELERVRASAGYGYAGGYGNFQYSQGGLHRGVLVNRGNYPITYRFSAMPNNQTIGGVASPAINGVTVPAQDFCFYNMNPGSYLVSFVRADTGQLVSQTQFEIDWVRGNAEVYTPSNAKIGADWSYVFNF